MGIRRSRRYQSRAKRRHERSCSKTSGRARAANSRWAKFARLKSALVYSLRSIESSRFRRLADQVEQCHRWFHGYRCVNGHIWARPGFSCKLRLCPFEMRARSMAALHKFAGVIDSFREPKYLVLTIENCPLRELRRGIDDLFSAFGRLRHSHVWAGVRGALAVLEITFNERTRTWHPHLNVLFDGPYIPKPDLDAAWVRATNGHGRITWIKLADRQTVGELLKYVTKLLDFVHIPEAVEWFILATHGRHFTRPYGSLYRLKRADLDGEHDDRSQEACPDCGSRDLEELPASLRLDDVYFDGSGVLRYCVPCTASGAVRSCGVRSYDG